MDILLIIFEILPIKTMLGKHPESKTVPDNNLTPLIIPLNHPKMPNIFPIPIMFNKLMEFSNRQTMQSIINIKNHSMYKWN